MWQMIVGELTQATQELARAFAHIIPRIIVVVIMAFVGWVVAYVLKVLLRSALRLIRFDKLAENAGASQLLTKAALPSATDLVCRFVFWMAWLGFILLGMRALGIAGFQEQIAKFFLFLPRLFVALLTIFVGLLGSAFLARAALLAAVNANLPSARLLSICIRTIIIVFVFSMAFEEVGVAEQTMLVAFGIVFGATMLGLAIAFGTGGKDLARQFLERKFVRGSGKDEGRGDDLSPL
jgi:Mechanosensitive ion channel, conserved TM helix